MTRADETMHVTPTQTLKGDLEAELGMGENEPAA